MTTPSRRFIVLRAVMAIVVLTASAIGFFGVFAARNPGTPVLPMMTTGATDGVFITEVGIPTYGVEGMFSDPDLGHIHGLNERIRGTIQGLVDESLSERGSILFG